VVSNENNKTEKWGAFLSTNQSIESFVAETMDDAPLTSFHWRVIALISAGLFLDLLDIAVFGSVVPGMVRSHFATVANISLITSSLFTGLFIGSVGQGEFTDRFGRKAVYQANLLIFGVATVALAFSPNYVVFAILRFIAGIGLGAETPLCFAYAAEFSPKRVRGRLLATTQFIGGACSWPIAILFVLLVGDTIGWRGVFLCIGIFAIIVFILRFSLPESPRWLATHGQKEKALQILARMKLPGPKPGQELVVDAVSATRSDPFLVIFRQNVHRVIFVVIASFTVFGVGLMLATWLPSMMVDRGFTITKALSFTFGMTLSFPLSSLFLIFALDYFGRKVTAVTSLFAAGILALLFWHSTSETMLLVTGFFMFFAMQAGTNAMILFTSEVFPTNARGTGLGIAFGVGKLAAVFSGYGIVIVKAYGGSAAFEVIAAFLAVSAIAVLLIGRETKGLALNVIAPPTA
jgi:putative MFS transporter